MTQRRKVEIYDTTLRDGAQGMGISFSAAGKLRLARKLDEFGVSYIEGGYAASSGKDMDFFRQAAQVDFSRAQLVAFGSTRRPETKVSEDEAVGELLKANTPVVAIVGKAWGLHVTDVLKTSEEENLAMIADTVEYLKKQGKRVFFDAEHFFDGYKDGPEFAMKAIGAAVDAGCDSVVLCDTNGGCLPNEIFEIVSSVREKVSVPLGIHAHNDGGMAVANSVEAVRAGADQVQGTVNGYGERCGNADLCSIIPTLELKLDIECVPSGSLAEIRDVSLFVDDLVNVRHDSRLPYVGKSAFAHKGGMHVNAVEKNPVTFEHVPPEKVGNARSVLLSEGSGKSSVLLKAIELGVSGVKKSSRELREVLDGLKELESKGYAFEAADASFKILVQKILKEHRPFFELEGFRVIVEKRGHDEACLSEATVKVRVGDEIAATVGEGNGPVDALDNALRKALKRFYPSIAKVVLKDYRVRILDPEEATAATTRVLMESSDGKSSWGTVGVSENIIEASWEALVDSVEYKLFKEEENGKGE